MKLCHVIEDKLFKFTAFTIDSTANRYTQVIDKKNFVYWENFVAGEINYLPSPYLKTESVLTLTTMDHKK